MFTVKITNGLEIEFEFAHTIIHSVGAQVSRYRRACFCRAYQKLETPNKRHLLKVGTSKCGSVVMAYKWTDAKGRERETKSTYHENWSRNKLRKLALEDLLSASVFILPDHKRYTLSKQDRTLIWQAYLAKLRSRESVKKTLTLSVDEMNTITVGLLTAGEASPTSKKIPKLLGKIKKARAQVEHMVLNWTDDERAYWDRLSRGETHQEIMEARKAETNPVRLLPASTLDQPSQPAVM